MRGWLVRGVLPADGARRLLAAVILRAMLDARNGCAEAREWLVTVGQEWAAVLGIDGARLLAWGSCDLAALEHGARRAAEPAQRSARRRAYLEEYNRKRRGKPTRSP